MAFETRAQKSKDAKKSKDTKDTKDKRKVTHSNSSDDESYDGSFIDEDDSYIDESDEETIGTDDSFTDDSDEEDEGDESESDDDEDSKDSKKNKKINKKNKKSNKNKKNDNKHKKYNNKHNKHNKQHKKNKKNSSDEDSDDDSDESDETEDSEDAVMSHKDIQRVIGDVFKSKYMDKKIRQLEKEEKSRRRSRRRPQESDDEESDNSSDDDEDDEDYTEEDDEDANNTFSIILMGDGEEETETYNEADDKYDCNSDDEQTFMKEKYEKIDLPPQFIKRKNQKPKAKNDEEEEPNIKIAEGVEKDYLDLLDTKKDLTKQLQRKPKSKFLMRAIRQCDKEIKRLVKKNRIRNAKTYHKLIQGDKKNTNEIEYFKTKLSNQEQLKVMKDLKEVNSYINIDKPYRLALLESQIPPKYKAIALQKLNTLKTMEPGDPEYYKLKHWVDAFMRIPFSKYQGLSICMKDGIDKCHEYMLNAKKSLDSCVYGLNDAKLQIMQMVGQWISNPNSMGTAIAIKGPMGTGKTTLVKEGISKILGREFAFIALGGNSDASFLEGHSYTYEGSNWGKIVQIILESKCMNPVIYFDELDKVSDTPKGEEIIGILTHLTDTSQNSEYHDKYFSDISFDLSKCLFIFSYNDESKVNPILRDRMYRIQTKGYETKEKLIIARQHLLPKIREQVNFTEEEVILPDETIQYIISSEGLTQKEDGVRNLKRCLEIIYTKINLFRLIKDDDNIFKEDIKIDIQFPFTVQKEHVDILIKQNDKSNPSLFGLYV